MKNILLLAFASQLAQPASLQFPTNAVPLESSFLNQALRRLANVREIPHPDTHAAREATVTLTTAGFAYLVADVLGSNRLVMLRPAVLRQLSTKSLSDAEKREILDWYTQRALAAGSDVQEQNRLVVSLFVEKLGVASPNDVLTLDDVPTAAKRPATENELQAEGRQLNAWTPRDAVVMMTAKDVAADLRRELEEMDLAEPFDANLVNGARFLLKSFSAEQQVLMVSRLQDKTREAANSGEYYPEEFVHFQSVHGADADEGVHQFLFALRNAVRASSAPMATRKLDQRHMPSGLNGPFVREMEQVLKDGFKFPLRVMRQTMYPELQQI